MSAASRSPRLPAWREMASLGEQIVSATTPAAQRERIVDIVSKLMEGEVELWLEEDVFRLPNAAEEHLFPEEPPLQGMRMALKAGRVQTRKQKGRGRGARGAWAAVPIVEHGTVLGALQVSRPRGAEFRKEELESLERLAGMVGMSLIASYRLALERFRLEQLNLVREVSAQIANVLKVDELARRVTQLIQETFHYYYVAIFTLQGDSTSLRFRASAMAPERGRRKAKVALQVELGDGLIGEAAAVGERVVVDDVRKDPRYRFIDSLPETRSEVVLPLKIGDRVLGVLDLQSDQVAAFHPTDLLILGALADTIGRAVEGARLYSDLRRRADQLAVIAEVSRSVSSSLELTTLMNNVASLIHDRFGHLYVHLFSVHENRRIIEYQAGSGPRRAKFDRFVLSLDADEGMIPWVARSGKTVLSNDVRRDKRFRPSPLPPEETRSELCVPLRYDEEVVGVLDIHSEKRNAFTDDDRTIFEAVAGNIATAIHNADLYRSEQWRRQVSDGLREVAGLISADVGVDDVLEAILYELDRNLPVDVSAIWLMEDDSLYLAASHNIDEDLLERTLYASPEAYAGLLTVLYSNQPLIRKPEDPIWVTGIAAGFESNYSALAVPLRVGDQPYGVITLAHSTPGRYGNEAQTMATTFASYAAVAIENARLYDVAQEQAYASAALLQVAQAVVSLSDLDEILGTIIRTMPILVGVERAALYLWDSAAGVFQASQQYGLDQTDEAAFWSQSLAPGEFPFLDSTRDGPGLRARQLDGAGGLEVWRTSAPDPNVNLASSGRLLFAVPIAIKHDLYGVMLIEEAAGGLRFRARRLEIITGIAQQAALAIQNDLLQNEMVARERLETEVQLARQIQQTFLPESLPHIPGWELAARWKTAREVGGDFYDVFELPNRKIGLFIADVADKGVPAALFMALTRTLVRAAVIETENPAHTLKRVNDLLVPDTRQGMFVTAVYALLDLDRSELTYVNAGHNPPLWVRADGSLERLTRTGVALGAAEDVAYVQRTIPLRPGDGVLLYTDGLTESFNIEDEPYGEPRLMEAIVANNCSSAAELLDVVENSLLNFVKDIPPADDLTMLALRRV